MRHMEIEFPHGKKLRLVVGDITKIRVDAIVNAANAGLHGGGGVDGAIHRAGGPNIMRELDAIRANAGGCPTGSAVSTTAGSLPAQFVFHAVGPIYQRWAASRTRAVGELLSCVSRPGGAARRPHHQLSRDQHGRVRLSARGSGSDRARNNCVAFTRPRLSGERCVAGAVRPRHVCGACTHRGRPHYFFKNC